MKSGIDVVKDRLDRVGGVRVAPHFPRWLSVKGPVYQTSVFGNFRNGVGIGRRVKKTGWKFYKLFCQEESFA